MNFKKTLLILSLLLTMVLLVACNNDTNEVEKSVLEKNVEGRVYTNNGLRQLMITGNPKSVKTKLAFTADGSWGDEQATSCIAFGEFKSWLDGELILDEEGYVTQHNLNSNNRMEYTVDENGLRSSDFIQGSDVARRLEEKLEGDYIAEYMMREGSDKEFLVGKYVKDSDGKIIKKLDCNAGGGKTYDIEYEYENGNLKKISILKDGIYSSSSEVEYNVLPVKLTLNNSEDLKLVYTFDYEFDEEGNWIKCNKYEEGKLIITYERTIMY